MESIRPEWADTCHAGWTHNRLPSGRHVSVMNCSACDETESLLVWTARGGLYQNQHKELAGSQCRHFHHFSPKAASHYGRWRNIEPQSSAVNWENNVSRRSLLPSKLL